MSGGFQGVGHRAFLFFEELMNRVFSPRFNPMYYLGAIAFLFIWMVFISGFYLLFIYRVSVDRSYDSLEDLHWFNQFMRSMHRYASDGAMIALFLHLLREYFNDRYRDWRWVAWVTGVALVAVYWLLGVTGYWMVWDQRAQLIARMTAEFLDFFPIWGEPLTRAFLSNDTITNVLFIGVIFLHLSLPTVTLFLLWMHVIRISRPVINPPRQLIIAFTALTVIACFAYPAMSVARADLGIVAASFGIDWLFLVMLPAVAAFPLGVSWAITLAGTGLLTFIPWIGKAKKLKEAEVILRNCVGCELCFKDCPYEAISMRPRSDGQPYREEAVVVPQRCASCGLCVGACDYHAIDLPEMTEEMIMNRIASLVSSGGNGGSRILLVACSRGMEIDRFIDQGSQGMKDRTDVKVMALPCVAMLQPAMIEHALRSGANGVFIAGCRTGDCHYREGDAWMEQRLLNERPPAHSKKQIEGWRVRAGWFSAVQGREFISELDAFIGDLKAKRKDTKPSIHRYVRDRLSFAGTVVLSVPMVLMIYLSDAPYTFFGQDQSLLRFSIKHIGQRIEGVEPPSPGELAKLPAHMRLPTPPAGPRHPVHVEIEIDGVRLLSNSYRPRGLKRSGASYGYEKITVAPGRHSVKIRMGDDGDTQRFGYVYEKEMEFAPGRQVCIDFNDLKKEFFIRN